MGKTSRQTTKHHRERVDVPLQNLSQLVLDEVLLSIE